MTANESSAKTFYPVIFLILATLLCLLPFVGKAFNIDEPLFIWTARHIQSHPLDFYGFQINWYGTEMSAAEIIKNPPLASYYLALAATVAGWSEVSLHLAFLLPAVAAVLGTYKLAGELTEAPWLAALVALLTPVFVVSSATVMCDTMMLAAFVWSVFFWVRGLRCNSQRDLLLASLLVAICALTKYFGMSLIPLLFVYSATSRSDGYKKALFLLIPVAILLGYQWGTSMMYGRGMLLDAASYATAEKGSARPGLFENLITGLSFTGGCLLPTLFFAPRIWGRKIVVAFLAMVPLLTLALSKLHLPFAPPDASWGYHAQLALFVTAGIHLWALAFRDVRQGRDSRALLLFLWISGTFVFASYVNWSVNGRSILPMVPVAGMLVVRALSSRAVPGENVGRMRSWYQLPLAAGFLLSMAVAWGDYALAGTARQAAEVIASRYGNKSLTLMFQGHWGFQYYMEQAGAIPLDKGKPLPLSRLIMVVPQNNTNISPEILGSGILLPVLEFSPAGFVTTMNHDVDAGFYSSRYGALPVAFGAVPKERYAVALWQ